MAVVACLVKHGGIPSRRADSALSLLSELEFVDCDPVPVNYRQYVRCARACVALDCGIGGRARRWELRDGPSAMHDKTPS